MFATYEKVQIGPKTSLDYNLLKTIGVGASSCDLKAKIN